MPQGRKVRTIKRQEVVAVTIPPSHEARRIEIDAGIWHGRVLLGVLADPDVEIANPTKRVDHSPDLADI